MRFADNKPPVAGTGRWRELVVCFVVATAAAWLAVVLRQPLGRLFAEEYLELARILDATGSLTSLHRPPGYVAFLALLGWLSPAVFSGKLLFVYLVQGVLHGFSTAIVREEIGRFGSGVAPGLVALTFGLSPFALIAAGTPHYDSLHVFLLVLAAASVRRAFADDSRPRDSLLAGLIAAILALVRPMTLPWPLMLVGLALLVRFESRRVFLKKSGLILLGFGLALAPYAARNYHKTGRFILVNAQAGAALWPMTEVELSPYSNDYPWLRLWDNVGRPLVALKAPRLSSEDDPFQTRTIAINDFLMARSFENLSENPMRFVRNACRNALFFVSGDQEADVLFFRIAQGSRQGVLPPVRLFCVASNEILVVFLGLAGLVCCLARRKGSWLAAVSLFTCLWIVHSALYLDFRYLYVRIPLCVLIVGFALFGADDSGPRWIRTMVATVPWVMISSTLVAFIAVFF